MEKRIAQIKQELENAQKNERIQLLKEYQYDKRAGVKKLIEKYQKEEQKLEQEKQRIEKMKEFEYQYQMFSYPCGIDEAGRGPLAGPVVAGAVILKKEDTILYLNDSKKLSAKKREELFQEIQERALATGIGIVSPAIIDQINILQATYEAMRKAIADLNIKPDLLLNDAVIIPKVAIKQVSIIHGDSRSISIAAASIIAKVTRDKMMMEYDKIYPQYGFYSHKGYGSEAHIKALKEYGASPIHRKSFIGKFVSK